MRSPFHAVLAAQPTRRRPLMLLLAVAAIAVSVVAAPTLVDALASPRTNVQTPEADSLVADDLATTGTARHPKGVGAVEVVVKQLDQGLYWNGTNWQAEFVRVDALVDRPGSKRTGWRYEIGARHLDGGNYRVRAFARSVEGNGDAYGGDQVEFIYLDRDQYDTEITSPAVGANIHGPVAVSGIATSSDGVAGVEVVVRNLDLNRYWDAGQGVWSEDFVRNPATLGNPGAAETSWSIELPVGESPDGRYKARAWVRTVTDHGDPFGRGQVNFSVSSATTPTVPGSTTSTTAVSSTTPTTTVVPSSTATTATTAAPPTTSAPPITTAPTSTTKPTTGSCPAAAAPLEPCKGVIIGASGDFTDDDGNGRNKQEHFSAREQQLDAEFDLFHDFLQWNDLVNRAWPNNRTQALADDGRIIMINWKPPTGHPNDWARIADGDLDADVAAAAAQIKDFGRPVFVAFHHEPEDNIRDAANGDQAKVDAYINDYRSAFRHLHDRFEAHGADNVVWVWDMQGWLRGFESYYSGGLYPGDDVVDWIGWNPYNWYGCVNHGSSTKWVNFTETVAPFYDWLDEGGPGRPSTDKPLMLGEWGSEENRGAANSNQSKAQWIGEAHSDLAERFPRLKALVYFDTEGRRSNGTVQFCRWGLDSSPSALASMSSMLNDPALNPQW